MTQKIGLEDVEMVGQSMKVTIKKSEKCTKKDDSADRISSTY